MADRSSGGWTRMFRRGEDDAIVGEDFLVRFLQGVARIFEGGSEAEALEKVKDEIKALFGCDDATVFVYDPDLVPNVNEGDWVLVARAGFGVGNRVSQLDAATMPSLVSGKRFPYNEQLATKAVLKAIALSFEEDRFYGCDIEQKKVILLRDPKPEDDMGSGDLSMLAIPLNYHHRVGRVIEKTRVGVLALYKAPVRADMNDLEGFLRSMLAYAVTTPSCVLRDPVTTLYTEHFLREQLALHMNMFDMTSGKLRGGLVVGMVDTLRLYKQTLETEAAVDPGLLSQRVSEVLRGVGQCIWKRARDHMLGPRQEFRCGLPGRIGHEGFGVILPLLRPVEQKMWAVRVSRDVIAYPFTAEEHLPAGDVTVSLRVIPFGHPGARRPEEVWKTATEALSAIEGEQQRALRDKAALARAVGRVEVLDEEGTWLPSERYTGPKL